MRPVSIESTLLIFLLIYRTSLLSTRKTATNTTADKHEVDDITIFGERKFNDLNQIMEKRLHKPEDQIIGLQNLNLSGNVANNKLVRSDNDLYRP